MYFFKSEFMEYKVVIHEFRLTSLALRSCSSLYLLKSNQKTNDGFLILDKNKK